MVGDAVQCINSVSADIIFLSPPWGGPSYQNQVSHLHSLRVSNITGVQLLQKALQITNNVVYYLPRNLNLDGVMSLGIPFEVRIFLSKLSLEIMACTGGKEHLKWKTEGTNFVFRRLDLSTLQVDATKSLRFTVNLY